MDRICRTCQTKKTINLFHFIKRKPPRKHTICRQCKACRSIQRRGQYIKNKERENVMSRLYYQQNREWLLKHDKKRRMEIRFKQYSLMDNKQCIDCGIDDLDVLQWDHIDPKSKTVCISNASTLTQLTKEVAKCVIRCGNCHFIRTSTETHKQILNSKRTAAAIISERGRKIRRKEVNREKKRRGGCMDCKLSDMSHMGIYHFDHRDPSMKISEISRMVSSRKPLSQIIPEMAKCDLVCVNCHQKRTKKQFNHYRVDLYNRDKELGTWAK